MNNAIKLFYSLLVGVVAAVIAKFVHANWSLTNLFAFGLIVFLVTFILTLFIRKNK
jgi:membrane protein YdbS with pleckstrin-like domain